MNFKKILVSTFCLLSALTFSLTTSKVALKTSAEEISTNVVYADNLDNYLTVYSSDLVVSSKDVIKINKDTSFTAVKTVYSFKIESNETFSSSITCVINTNDIAEENIRILKIKDNSYSALTFDYSDNKATFYLNEPGLFALVNLSDSLGVAQDPIWIPIVIISVSAVGIIFGVLSLIKGGKKHE